MPAIQPKKPSFRPFGKNILIRIADLPEQTRKSGVITPTMMKPKHEVGYGEIVALPAFPTMNVDWAPGRSIDAHVTPDDITASGSSYSLEDALHVGDFVAYDRHGGYETLVDGDAHICVSGVDVLGVYENVTADLREERERKAQAPSGESGYTASPNNAR